MPHPFLYLFYPRRNPSLSYTRQVQVVIAFILFVLITVSSSDPSGVLFIPSLGASAVIAVTSILLSIATTDLSRTIEDHLENAINYRLQRVAPHHARIIKNNLQPINIRDTIFTSTDANVVPPYIDQDVQVIYNELPVKQFEILNNVVNQHNQHIITLRDYPGIIVFQNPIPNYINNIPYQHVREDTFTMAESLVSDPPILIDPRMILFKFWQRGRHSGIKEVIRWGCYVIHILIYTSPVWWAFWTEPSWEKRLIPVIVHSFILIVIISLIILHDFRICSKALEDGNVEKYLYRLYDTHQRFPQIERLPYNRSLYIMHLLNVIANYYKD